MQSPICYLIGHVASFPKSNGFFLLFQCCFDQIWLGGNVNHPWITRKLEITGNFATFPTNSILVQKSGFKNFFQNFPSHQEKVHCSKRVLCKFHLNSPQIALKIERWRWECTNCPLFTPPLGGGEQPLNLHKKFIF